LPFFSSLPPSLSDHHRPWHHHHLSRSLSRSRNPMTSRTSYRCWMAFGLGLCRWGHWLELPWALSLSLSLSLLSFFCGNFFGGWVAFNPWHLGPLAVKPKSRD
jgi:hypothetical protein